MQIDPEVVTFVDKLLDDWANAELGLVLEVGNSVDERNVHAAIAQRQNEWALLQRGQEQMDDGGDHDQTATDGI